MIPRDQRVSRELFDRGTPIRQIRKGTEYVKRGDRFGFFQDGKFIDTPRAALSR